MAILGDGRILAAFGGQHASECLPGVNSAKAFLEEKGCLYFLYPALFLGLLGFGGGMSIQFLLPKLGAIFDEAKIEVAGGVEAFEKLSREALDVVLTQASVESFQAVAAIPLLLLPVFGFIWFLDRRKAGAAIAEEAKAVR